jgi:hypothetical protein
MEGATTKYDVPRVLVILKAFRPLGIAHEIAFDNEHKNKSELYAERTKSNFERVQIRAHSRSDSRPSRIMSSVENWATIDRNGSATAGDDEVVDLLGERQEWPASPDIRDHDAAHFDKIWGDYEKEKKAMLYQVGAFLIEVLLAMLTDEISERAI